MHSWPCLRLLGQPMHGPSRHALHQYTRRPALRPQRVGLQVAVGQIPYAAQRDGDRTNEEVRNNTGTDCDIKMYSTVFVVGIVI